MHHLPWLKATLFLLSFACFLLGCKAAPPPPTATAVPPKTVAPTTTASPSPSATATSVPTPTATGTAVAAIPPLRGDLGNQIALLEAHMPRAASNGYRPPTAAEQTAFAQLRQALQANAWPTALALAMANGYELYRYTDRGDGRAESWLLRESRPIQRGWGLYLFRVGSDSPLIIEAPHPLFDAGTPNIALALYRTLNGRALLIAGAHRSANPDDVADVAHTSDTIFQTLHQALAEEGERVVLQVHGFASDNHADYPAVVLGSDQATASPLLHQIADALAAQNISAGVCDGVQWRDLCGTTNVQSATMPQGTFIHLELNEAIRQNPAGLLVALTAVFGE